MACDSPAEPLRAFTEHPRGFRTNQFVYPVVSRRSRGASIGINLNPDKVCNFDCVYCQVDRRDPVEKSFVGIDTLRDELARTLELTASGALFDDPAFQSVPPPLRRLNDIAFSGDGEPTSFSNFSAIIAAVADVRNRFRLEAVKLVLITNASLFHQPRVREALAVLDRAGSEIWAKLDAGTEAYYQRVNRAVVPFSRILDNLRSAAQARALVIQTLFMRLASTAPPLAEIDAYGECLGSILAAGGRIDRVQIYTVARRPAEPDVQPLSPAELDAIAARVHSRICLPIETYPGLPA